MGIVMPGGKTPQQAPFRKSALGNFWPTR